VNHTFCTIEVSPNAPEETENLGTKEKFWFQHADLGRCLFKKARPNTGEDWSEKIAAELCRLIGLPYAEYELATFTGQPGTVSLSFIPEGGSLSLGNEILSQLISEYPQNKKDPSQHTVVQVFDALKNLDLPPDWTPPDGIKTSEDLFLGYLLLDAWIGNTDRHHENWGVIRLRELTYLAPTYDHASSLGRSLTDQERQKRLNTPDPGYSVQAYVEKGQSCLYNEVTDKKPLKLYDAFCQAAKLYPDAAHVWLDMLATISADDTLTLLQKIPEDRISPVGIEFDQKILEINQNRLLEFKSQLS
jgi:hypothetical protein